jgi:hypothetical protein
MAVEPMTTVPTRIIELIARCLQLAGENSAAGYSLLDDYSDADQKTVERRAYDLFNEIDSDLACADGYFADHFGEEWRLIEQRGLERWEAMAG